MIFPQKNDVGCITLSPAGPFRTGERLTLLVTFVVGNDGLKEGAQLRIGLPIPAGNDRSFRNFDIGTTNFRKGEGIAPFHPVNTTAALKTSGKATIALESMERMLLPDEDPAEA
jgi:hypothetical protein